MKTFRLLSIVTLALAPAVAAGQTIGWRVPAGTNIIDFGARGTDLTGDSARYERYRDLGDGLFLEAIRWEGLKNDWRLSLSGDHSLYKDQRFVARAIRPGRTKVWFLWDQVPMLMSNTTETLYQQNFDPYSRDFTAPSTLTISPSIRAQVQPSATATPNTSIVPTLFDQSARTFETEGRRNTLQTGMDYIASQELSLRAVYQFTSRQGNLPYGGSFGHSSLVEMPAPIAHTTNDFDTNVEFVRDRFLFRGGYTGSWFHNDNLTATFDNPFRTYDSGSAPATGALSLAPSNSFFTLNGLASVKLAARSRLTFYIAGGALKDAGDPLMGQTVNTANAALITPLDRTLVEGEARTLTTNLTFVSRPSQKMDFSAKFRTYDYDNQTPEFAMTQRVSYDNAPGVASMSTLGGVTVPYTTNPIHSEPFGVVRKNLDLDFRLTPKPSMTFGVGYTYYTEDRSHRFFEETTDNVFRVSFDTVGNQYLTLRTKYEHVARRADVIEEAELELYGIGEQPGIRHFDIAQRDRDRVTILGVVTPKPDLAFSGSVAFGKDDYFESLFGLRDNTHRVYTVGLDATPTDKFFYGVSYSYEHYNAFSRSRQANPPSPTITYAQYLAASGDPNTTIQVAAASRNWASDGTDRVHSLIFASGVTGIRNKVDLHFSYDMNRAEASYNYETGPVGERTLPDEVPVDTTLTNCNQPENCQLPLVKNYLDRFTTDVTFWVNPMIGIGGSYWFEKYQVEDWALDAEATSREVLSQAMILGYNYRPYTANTFFARLLLRF
jgi:MtrB/PioB family decaheme-associated outer membrane protein